MEQASYCSLIMLFYFHSGTYNIIKQVIYIFVDEENVTEISIFTQIQDRIKCFWASVKCTSFVQDCPFTVNNKTSTIITHFYCTNN